MIGSTELMNYYRRYMGDYLRKTAGLSFIEHGAYTLLLDYYYVDEKPLPLDLEELYRIVRAVTPEERAAVEKILRRYFVRRADGWHNERAEEEINAARPAIESARVNGRKGGRRKTQDGTHWVTGDEPTRNPVGSDEATHQATRQATQEEPTGQHPPSPNPQPLTPSPQPPSPNPQGLPPAARAACELYTTPFEELWKLYPKRDGDNPKRRAFKAYRARLAEGSSHEDIRAGVVRYAAWVRARGKEGTETVKQAATFFGPDKSYLQPWSAKAPLNKQEQLEQRNREIAESWVPPEMRKDAAY